MKLSYIFAVVSNFGSLTLVAGTITVSSLSITSCIPGSQQTTFPNCNNLNNYATCADTTSDPEWKACICKQEYLDSAFACESELRLCYQYNYLDPNIETALSLWHSLCNTYITFSPSTPSVTSIITSYDPNCAHDACRTASFLSTQCALSFVEAAKLTSCLCQPDFLTLDYSCEYIGNTSCLGVPATMSNLVGYDCPNFAAVIGTGTVPGSVVTLTAPTTSFNSITPGPKQTSSTASQTATTSKASDGSHEVVFHGILMTLCVSFFVTYYLVT